MSKFPRSAVGAALSMALVLGIAGCHHSQSQDPSATQASDQGDPAAANMAPGDNAAPAAEAAQQSPRSYAPAPTRIQYTQAPPDQGEYDQGAYGDTADEQPVYAPEPPPEMPEYEQPECPGDDYIWTPGYWYWSPAGYYWVPGAWVLAPYIGALWTPGYWGFVNNRYFWHYGYWGPYIGFYGGVNYGYGYYGNGYEGGYWNHGAFYYNRSITRVGGNIRRVYTHNVNFNNRSRISYNGGRGGLNARPSQSQQKAARSRRFGALPAQRELVQQSQRNRSQFAKVNQGRPAQVAVTRPVNGGRKAPAARPQDVRPATGSRPANGARPGSATRAPSNAHRPATNKPSPERPATGNRPTREQQRPVQQTRPEFRPSQQSRPQSRPAPQRQETRPAPQRPEYRRTPQRQEARPAPQRQEYRPAPQRQEARPAPQRQETRPAPQARSAPQHRESRPAPQHQDNPR